MASIDVGIDVGKDDLAVAVLPSGESFIELNDERAVTRLVQRLSALGCERIVLEASGGYETLVVGARWPRRACRWRSAIGCGWLPKRPATKSLDMSITCVGHDARHAMLKTNTPWRPPCRAAT